MFNDSISLLLYELLLASPYFVVYEIMKIVLTEVQIFELDQAESPGIDLSVPSEQNSVTFIM